MILFYYDPLSNLSCSEQYLRYLENENYVRNLKSYTDDPLNYQLLEIKRTIEGTNATLQASAIENSRQYTELITTIHGSLEQGFNDVVNELEITNWKLNEIGEGINDLKYMVDWKTDLIIEEQRISNFYLENITELLKIPEMQKLRAYHIDRGCTWLKNAADSKNHQSQFYDYAVEEFEKALSIEKRDYFSLQQMGLVFLNSIRHFNVTKALQYFEESAIYAKAIANVTPSGNGRNGKAYNPKLDKVLTKELLLHEAALSLYYASMSQYFLIDFDKGAALAKEAWDLQPLNPEFGYQMAKCFAASKKDEKALEILFNVIELSPQYVNKIRLDADFISKPIIVQEINKFCTTFLSAVEKKLIVAKESILPDSVFKNRLIKIEEVFNPKSYPNARKVSADLDSLCEAIENERKERREQAVRIQRADIQSTNAANARLASNICIAIFAGPVLGFIGGLIIDFILQIGDLFTKKNGAPDAVTNVRFHGAYIGLIIGLILCFVARGAESKN